MRVKSRWGKAVQGALAPGRRDCLARDGALRSKSLGKRSSRSPGREGTTSQSSPSSMPLSAIQKVATAQVSSKRCGSELIGARTVNDLSLTSIEWRRRLYPSLQAHYT
jgi:hypothetical protein